MNAEFTTIIGQLSISDGKWRSDAPNQVAVREPKAADAPGAGKGDLFIITEIQGDGDNLEEMEAKLAQAIRDSYYLARGSITASLRRAIQAGSDLLYNRNKKVAVEERVVGGVAAMAVSNEDVFVAQIGPTAFFAILGDHIRRYPQRSVWLDEALGPEPEDAVSGLGLNRVVEPGVHHLRVVAEDVLILADSRLAGQLPLKEVVRAVNTGDIKATVKNLGDVAQTRTGSALVLEVIQKTETAPASASARIAPPPQLGKLWAKARLGKKTEPEPEAETEPETVVAGAKAPKNTAVFASTAAVMQRPLSWLGNFTGRAKAPEPAQPEIPELRPAPKIDTERWFGPEKPAYPPEPEDDARHAAYQTDDDDWPAESRQKPGLLNRVGALFLALVAAIGGGLRHVLGMFGGSNNDDQPRQAGTQARASAAGFSWKTLRTIAIFIPLVVAIIVGISYIQKGRLREAEYQDYFTSAKNKVEQTQSVDPQSARALMSEAETLLVQAEKIKPSQPEISELRQQMAGQVDKVGNVYRLDYFPQLRRYTDPGTQTANIVVQGVELYVLDNGNGRVYHHRLNAAGDALLPDTETVLMTAKGQQVDNITVGDMLGMAWMPIGGSRQTSDLVILNSAGMLEYDPSWGITTAKLAGVETLKKPTAVASYFGNFYVLDAQANSLLRYLPTADGYNSTPQSYFTAAQPVNLANAVDVAIDGAVYILFKDGQIKKYLSGQQAEFNLTGLDVPLSKPVAIFTLPDEQVQHLYIADAGNQRIVQLTKDGKFVRQFKPQIGEPVTFANLQDVYVDEIGGRLFVLDSNNLYLGKIPAASAAQPKTAQPGAPPAAPSAPAAQQPAN